MADVITRFKLETSQYDSKLRDASKGLADYARMASTAGKEFDKFTKNNVSVAQALGNMQTSATNAKEKVKELVGAFNTAASAYNALTKEQQQSDWGKALAESLQTLKGRITEAKQELYSVGDAGKGTSGIMDTLAEKFTVNIDAMKLFNMGLAAASKALDVAKDAFFNNEEQLDEWGRVVESSHSLYTGFLNALNTGDISGYLSNINNIVKAARDAYDALDALGTYNAFNQINVEKTRTGMTESIADYRGGTGSKDAVKAAGEAYKKELKDRKRLENEAYLEAVKRVAAERGVSAKDLQDALSGTYGHYQDLKNVQPTGVGTRYTPGIMPGSQGSYTQYTYAQNREEKLGEALRHLNDTELQSLQALGAQAQRTGNEIAQVDKQLTRVLNGRQNGQGSGGNNKPTKIPKPEEILPAGSVAALNKEMQELRKEQSMVTNTKDWKAYEEQIRAIGYQIRELKGELGIEALRGLKGVSISDGINIPTRDDIIKRGDQRIKDFKISGGEDLAKQGKQAQKAWNLAAQAVSSVGDAFNSIEDPGVKAMGTVAQAIASIALGFAQASVTASSMGPWGWVAFLAAGAAAMATTISTVHSLTGFANGGIVDGRNGGFVGGTNFSGDNIGNVRLNSGELVLNQAQAGVIANALQDREFGSGASLQPYVEGEKIFLGMNNTSKRMGRGEIVTTSTLRHLGLI